MHQTFDGVLLRCFFAESLPVSVNSLESNVGSLSRLFAAIPKFLGFRNDFSEN